MEMKKEETQFDIRKGKKRLYNSIISKGMS